MSAGRPELFPPDRGLQARMALTIVAATFLLTAYLGALAGALALLGGGLWSAVLIGGTPLSALAMAWVHARRARIEPAMSTRQPNDADVERLRAATDRLCAIAALDPPETKVVGDRVPLSWTTMPLDWTPCIHVSTGMLDALPERELLAVIAHELAHIAHRDAVVMTLVGGPSVYIVRSARLLMRDDPFRGSLLVLLGAYVVVPALVFGLLSRVVSRYRELAADRSAALITGSPAALASALVRLREDMTRGGILLVDLKVAAPRNGFHVIPVERREPRGLRRVWASHPPLEARLDALDRMERNLQWARGPGSGVLEDDPPAATTTQAGSSSDRIR